MRIRQSKTAIIQRSQFEIGNKRIKVFGVRRNRDGEPQQMK